MKVPVSAIFNAQITASNASRNDSVLKNRLTKMAINNAIVMLACFFLNAESFFSDLLRNVYIPGRTLINCCS